MAVGDFSFPEMPEVSGIRIGTACAGIRQTQRDDLVVVEMYQGTACTAVFTRNAFCAAPVQVARENLHASPRWLLINSGNANAGTGKKGVEDTIQTCEALGKVTGGTREQVLPFSTGVIGEFLPLGAFQAAIPEAVENLSATGWQKGAKAILTTDTRAKGSSRLCEIGGHPVVVNGIAKGSGMIHPNMATMLAFIGTDAGVEQDVLSPCLNEAVNLSFNRISVDGDTSTNDACVLMATGTAGSRIEDFYSDACRVFRDTVNEVCADLAEQIVRDGEGATKLLRIVIEEALTEDEASDVGRTIATSPLVKTALFAGDPNWGRMLAAIGRSGIEFFRINDVRIWLGSLPIVCDGGVAPNYSESEAQAIMNQDEVTLRVALRRGNAVQTYLTSDLSYDYVRINAEYRT